jgi:GTPase
MADSKMPIFLLHSFGKGTAGRLEIHNGAFGSTSRSLEPLCYYTGFAHFSLSPHRIVFVDHLKIFAKAGDGGNGSPSFRREKFIPRGGPDGGDGGRGGSIILRVDPHTDNLKQLFYNPNLRAEHGKNGAGRQCTGKCGKDLIVLVPAGTLIYKIPEAEVLPVGCAPSLPEGGDMLFDDEDGDEEQASLKRSLKQLIQAEELEVVADLTKNGDEFVLVKGGKGGKGNINFKTPTHRAPTETTPGEKGEVGMFYFELRQIADAGLVGFPNAGKSTILTKLSAARPKVAAYPFTTLKPMVGVIEYPGYERATLADIPGLIEGAHENVGLGHDFLRHILRCRLLVFVVDVAGSEGRHPADDVATLRTEISMYDKLLAKRPWILVANKMDLPEAEEKLAELKQRFPKVKVLPVSADGGEGMDKLAAELRKRVGYSLA